MSSHSGEEGSQDSEEVPQKRKSRFIESLESRSQKRKKNSPVDPYKKFVGFYTRSQDAFINYSLVLDAAMSLEVEEYGDLTEEEFLEKNYKQLKVYKALRKSLPQFSKDFLEFQEQPEQIEEFAKLLDAAVTAARGADISTLREAGLEYIALEQPDELLLPKIRRGAEKNTTRGHHHPVLSRLLCPVALLSDYDADPEEFRKKLLRNKIKVFAGDYPALLYPSGGFDPDDPESGLLRNLTLVRFFKHIFTAPTSAKKDLSAPNKTKTKRPQAELNNMKKVTPGSIVYAALMFRHCISALDDWRTEDDLFDRCLFAQSLFDLLDDADDTWTQDTLAWWNAHIFGTPPEGDSEDENHAPTMANTIREKRAARKAADKQEAGDARHREWQRSKGVSSSTVTDKHAQQSDTSGERGGDVQDDEDNNGDDDDADDDDQRHPQNGSPFEERQNLPPRHQRVSQTSTWHQSHSPIATQRSHRPRSPSTRRFQSSPTQPSRRRDEFSCSPRRAQGSSHHHYEQRRDDQRFSRRDQDSSRRIPLSPSPPLSRNLVRRYAQ
ncbi:hypothetical protein M413DRAFT_14685 [Hebeloma cylindrosporum]|uniref:Uncharacterized protein n=1 Tax=Hebeloma cylindrosporum TaxID=76867 RepID=A0A0C3BT27_HEBCY|nr:hypothetical protein M413DRAFT_14685 [Hebeloma cylindrosporum h7]